MAKPHWVDFSQCGLALTTSNKSLQMISLKRIAISFERWYNIIEFLYSSISQEGIKWKAL